MKATCDRHTKEIEASGGSPNVGRDIRTCNGCLAATIKWEMGEVDKLRGTLDMEEVAIIFEKQEKIETLTNSLLNHLIKGE